MRSTEKNLLRQVSGKSCFSKREIGSKLSTTLQNKNGCRVSYTKRYKRKPRSHVKTLGSFLSKRRVSDLSSNGSRNNFINGKLVRRSKLHGFSDINSSEKQSSLKPIDGKSLVPSSRQDQKNADGDAAHQKIDKKRKRKRRKEHVERDEASRLQRRTRYLLIKMKLEQNLIDAYSGEGWKGQSREKIKPEKELQRAKKQILKCKLGIRETIRQLDLLSSEGSIEDAVIGPDGAVFHEHIFCAKCKLRDAFPDNDIILCDGTCNCAFHQKCLEPPLATENIPPGDQGWFCKFCERKMEILEAINAHLGTRFSTNSKWQDIFKEAAAMPDGEGTSLNPEEEWPSDDSEDDDYDPERNEESGSCSRTAAEENMTDDSSSSSVLFRSSGEEVSSESGRSMNDCSPHGGSSRGKLRSRGSGNNFMDSLISLDSGDTSDREITIRRRQRRTVDYKKLHDEMFGKDVPENEQVSEDEDWGPGRGKRREKESDAANTLMTLCENEDGRSNMVSVESEKKLSSVSQDKKPLFRIPSSAVEKLRQVFAENELPSRAVRENLSRQLGLAFEKVNKWFKNARYMALKVRKAESKKLHSITSIPKESSAESGKHQTVDRVVSKGKAYLMPSVSGERIPKILREIQRRKNPKSINTSPKKKQHKKATSSQPSKVNEKYRESLVENHRPSTSVKRNSKKQLDISNDRVRTGYGTALCTKKQMGSSNRKTTSTKRISPMSEAGISYANKMTNNEQLYLVEMERLCCLKDKLDNLKTTLMRIRNDETHLEEQLVIYVPVAEVREKV